MTDELRFIEETVRDGQLSLWATRMNTETMLGIGRTIDRAGFERACVTSGAAFDTAVRFLFEDPWERLRFLRREMPTTPLEFLIRGRNLIGWKRYPNDVVRLLMQRIAATGFDWVLIFDGLNDMRNIAYHIEAAKEAGLKVSGVVSYTVSPVHTDEYFVTRAADLVRLGADVVNFYDAPGVLTPQRTRRLIPLLLEVVRGSGVELELNVHAATGLALDCYAEALRLGVRLLSTASMPLANGDSLPATTDVMRIAAEMGIRQHLDSSLVEAIDGYFEWVAYRESRPTGARVAFDQAAYDAYVAHQIPGGMMSNFVRQLTDLGQLARLPEILDEVARIRAEVGYPPMVTPYSQMVGVQATLNVLSGERYKSSPAELARYIRGEYGELAAPIAPDVLDKVCAGGESDPIDPSDIFEEPLLPQLRQSMGPVDDEELLMGVFYDAASMEKLRASRRPIDEGRIARTPLSALVKDLAAREGLRSLSVIMPGRPTYRDVLDVVRAVDAAPDRGGVDLDVAGGSISIERLEALA
jgi:oxaloacetate decarboxylase alpha subunit